MVTERIPDKYDWRHLLAAVLVLAILSIAVATLPAIYTDLSSDTGRLAVIKLDGAITSQTDLGSTGITPESVADLTENAVNERNDVIIYEINSPGGGVVASKDVARTVNEADLPTVCLLKEVAASGGYWLASACDHIVADSLTMTGSIGVTSAYLEFSDLMERYGIEYVNLTSGQYKDMGSQYRNITDEEREKFDDILDTVHIEFVETIADNRNMSTDAVEDVATGEVFLGREAQEYGLVDTLGSKETAVDVAKNLTGTTELRESTYQPTQQFNLFSMLFTKIGEGMIEGMKGEEKQGIQARY